MSEISPVYTTPAPALLTTAQLATLADTLAGERQSCADEPATPLGFWPTAVAALLDHAEALAMRVNLIVRASEEIDNRSRWMEAHRDELKHELEYTRQMGRETEKAMVTMAGRVKELQAELSEQEVEKMQLIRELSFAVGSAPLAAR